MNILMFGPQGSGKSTQARLLASDLGLPLVSAGDISREIAKENSERGRIVKEVLGKGELTPDRIIEFAINKRLSQTDCRLGFIADGWPRTLGQAKNADFVKRRIDVLVLINISQETAISRLLKRGRADDGPDSIKKRLAIYWQKTKPVISFYCEQSVPVLEIDGEQSIQAVQAKIVEKLKNLKKGKERQ